MHDEILAEAGGVSAEILHDIPAPSWRGCRVIHADSQRTIKRSSSIQADQRVGQIGYVPQKRTLTGEHARIFADLARLLYLPTGT